MKILNSISFIGLTLIIAFSSCSVEKRHYQSGYNIEWKNSKPLSAKAELKKIDKLNSLATKTPDESIQLPQINNANITASTADNTIIIPNQTSSVVEHIEDCDNIILKNGEEIKAHVVEVGADDIKYKKCANLNGPTYTVKKSEVFMIQYPNGTKDIISPKSQENKSTTNYSKPSSDENTNTEAKFEGLGLAGFICGIVGLIVSPLLFGLLALIFGAISLGKISKHPDKFKGKGFAIAALVLGIINIIWAIAVLSSL